VLFLCFTILNIIFAFGFVHQLQTAENTIFLVIFHRGLDGTMIIYTILACFVTQTTCPPGHVQHPMSQEGQKDHQGQQPPEPMPVHPATIQKVMSVQVHQSWVRETEKQLLFQGHH
jgi:hypothetical protein